MGPPVGLAPAPVGPALAPAPALLVVVRWRSRGGCRATRPVSTPPPSPVPSPRPSVSTPRAFPSLLSTPGLARVRVLSPSLPLLLFACITRLRWWQWTHSRCRPLCCTLRPPWYPPRPRLQPAWRHRPRSTRTSPTTSGRSRRQPLVSYLSSTHPSIHSSTPWNEMRWGWRHKILRTAQQPQQQQRTPRAHQAQQAPPIAKEQRRKRRKRVTQGCSWRPWWCRWWWWQGQGWAWGCSCGTEGEGGNAMAWNSSRYTRASIDRSIDYVFITVLYVQ